MVDIRTRGVFATMRPELLRVEARLEEAARIDYPAVSDLILGLVRAGGKRLRPLVLLLAGRSFDADAETLVTAGAGVELLHTANAVATVDTLKALEMQNCQFANVVVLSDEKIVAQNIRANDLALTKSGGIYFVDTAQKTVGFIDANGHRRIVYDRAEIMSPTAITVWLPEEVNGPVSAAPPALTSWFPPA